MRKQRTGRSTERRDLMPNLTVRSLARLAAALDGRIVITFAPKISMEKQSLPHLRFASQDAALSLAA